MREDLKLKITKVSVATPDGAEAVCAYETPLCPGLAVTCHEMRFNVTHLPTGMAMIAPCERAANAAEAMLQFGLIAKEYGFDWSEIDKENLSELMAKIGKEPVPFDSGLSVRMWVSMMMHDNVDEFPWEDETGPWARVSDLLDQLGADEDTNQ